MTVYPSWLSQPSYVRLQVLTPRVRQSNYRLCGGFFWPCEVGAMSLRGMIRVSDILHYTSMCLRVSSDEAFVARSGKPPASSGNPLRAIQYLLRKSWFFLVHIPEVWIEIKGKIKNDSIPFVCGGDIPYRWERRNTGRRNLNPSFRTYLLTAQGLEWLF